MHLEFVVPGPPVSNQSPGPNLNTWRATVDAEARKRWTNSVLSSNLKVILINFHVGNKPSVDIDNMSKPIFDAMQGIVYEDDRQIRQAEISYVPINVPLVFVDASMIVVMAVQAGNQFVYVRIEDAVDPFPLPKVKSWTSNKS
jgi:crossover junction endodeoxyribonuclease RusA